jgi:hypothetical protein
MRIVKRGLPLAVTVLGLMSLGGWTRAGTIVSFNEHEATEGPLVTTVTGWNNFNVIPGNNEHVRIHLFRFLNNKHAAFTESFELIESFGPYKGTVSDWVEFQAGKNGRTLTIAFQSDNDHGHIRPTPGKVYGTMLEPAFGWATIPTGPGTTAALAGTGNTLTVKILSSPIPEPSTLALAGLGALTLAGYTWRQRRARA